MLSYKVHKVEYINEFHKCVFNMPGRTYIYFFLGEKIKKAKATAPPGVVMKGTRI